MELRRYLEIIIRRWWIALTAFMVTVGATVLWALPQPKLYESTGTFVVGPRSADAEESVRAFDTLIRGEAINATYASIASSDLVRARAEERVDPGVDTDELDISAEVLTGTNVLEITVVGPDPEDVLDLAVAVSQEAVDYVSSSDEGYKLSPLDTPKLPRSPVAPKTSLMIAMGVFFGGALGLGLAFVVDYIAIQLAPSRRSTILEAPVPIDAAQGVHDRPAYDVPAEMTTSDLPFGDPPDEYGAEPPGILDEREFAARLKQEILSTATGFSFGLLRVMAEIGRNPAASRIVGSPTRIARVLRSTLRDEDVLARLDDGRLAVLLPAMPAAGAEALMLDWELVVASLGGRDNEARASSVHVSTGVSLFEDGGFSGDPEAVLVAESLSGLPSAIEDQDEHDPSERGGRTAWLR